MKSRIIALVIPLLSITLAGCTSSRDAGIFRSSDGGETYLASSTLDVESSLAGQQIFSLASHPARPQTVFAGVLDRGVVISADGGQNWTSTSLQQGTPRDIAIHPVNVSTVYFAFEQQIIRTTDDGQTFQTLYADPSIVTTVALDPATPANIWAGTSTGQVLHSSNEGLSWNVATSFKSAINDILISPLGSAIFVASENDGVAVSADRGVTFTDRTPAKADLPAFKQDVSRVIALAQSSQTASPIWAATDQGLLRSNDLGRTWQIVSNPLSESGVIVSELFVSDESNVDVLITANNTIAKSRDGGASWISRSLPSERLVGAVTFVDTRTIVVGVTGETEGIVSRTLRRE